MHHHCAYLKLLHEVLVSGEVSGEDEVLYQREDLLDILGGQVVQQPRLHDQCLRRMAVMLLQ